MIVIYDRKTFIVQATDYFATAVSYMRKMFAKSTTGVNLIKLFNC
jgi:hypothetical protein